MTKPRLRCAIYTRKSSDEGLEQDFNSLHAQREACEAYIRSQAGEGWVVLKTAYDDGGYSGGNTDRPALARLLADVDAGRIDTVVVYKVDRLTRSLADFAKIVDRFDAQGVSFVSVTQAFNTTSSMGRLTLNVLLSFAQFEREVTGERIRDKIAASKAKGMWMGGPVPLGYDAIDRKLVPNPQEAEQVRWIFRRYLELGSAHDLKAEVDREGIVSRRGKAAAPLSRGLLFSVLRNPLYIGKVRHKGLVYDGQHQAIVDPEVFAAVQARLDDNAVRTPLPARTAKAPLIGLIFDADGLPMSPTTAKGRRGGVYRYYVTSSLQRGQKAEPDGVIRRVAADKLEALVLDRVSAIAKRKLEWPEALSLIQRVKLAASGITVVVNIASLIAREGVSRELFAARLPKGDRLIVGPADDEVTVEIKVRPVFRGGRTWLVAPDGQAAAAEGKPDPALVKALRFAHQSLIALNASPLTASEDQQAARSPADSYVRRLVPLAFLAPDIQRAILEGRQPAGLTLQQLISQPLPLAWNDQRHFLGF